MYSRNQLLIRSVSSINSGYINNWFNSPVGLLMFIARVVYRGFDFMFLSIVFVGVVSMVNYSCVAVFVACMYVCCCVC